jgi:phage terminase small subunit
MTPKHTLWLANYLKDKDRNASAAARSAGYSAKSSAMQGARMLARPDIQAAIAAHDAAMAVNSRKTEKQVEDLATRVRNEIETVAFGNMQNLFDPETGEMLPIHKLPPEVAATLTAYENDKGFQRVKTASKMAALELMAKITQIVGKDQTQNQGVTIILGPAPELPERVDSAMLKPEW